MVTIKELANILGISTTTVSNVIHGKMSEVSLATVEKVQKLLEEYDYTPNINARNLAQNRSKIIGMALFSNEDKYKNIVADPFFGSLVGAIEKEVRKNNYFFMLYVSDDISEIIRYVSSWNVDGLITVGMNRDEYLKIRGRYKKPIVLIDSYAPKDIMDYVNVGLDDEGGGYIMTKYLIENGHRKIAFICDNLEGVDYMRYRGFKKAVGEAGIVFDKKNLIIISPVEGETAVSMSEVYEAAQRVTAMFCCSDNYALQVTNELFARGMDVPGDVSIAGFDDNIFAKVCRPALTTVYQDVDRKGTVAVEKLMAMLRGEENPKDEILPVKIVVRDSVRKL